MQQTAGGHTCVRPVTRGDPGDGPKADRVLWPLFRSQIWVMVLVGAAPIPPLRAAALGDRQPGVWLSVTTCPEINVRAAWPAVVTPPSAPRSLMREGKSGV